MGCSIMSSSGEWSTSCQIDAMRFGRKDPRPGRQTHLRPLRFTPAPREREHHHREHHHPMAFCQSRYSCTPGHEAKPQPLATYHCAMSGDFLPIESQTGSVAAGNVYIPRHSVVGQFGCYSFAKDTSISARRCSRNATSSSLRPW